MGMSPSITEMRTSSTVDARPPAGSGKNVRWAIVGGGMLGLAIAWRLTRTGSAVTVFETAPDIGGLAGTWKIGKVSWDRHYHVTLRSDLHLRGLLAELGIEREMRWSKTRTGFFTNGRVHSLSNLWEFVRFPPLNMWQRLRLALTISKAARLEEWKPLERVTAQEWLRKWSGQRNLDRIWMPLLRSKLGENAERVAATFIWATIARLYAVRQNHVKEELFGYHPGGYTRILARFAEALSERGVALRTGSRVEQIRTLADGTFHLRLQQGNAQVFDRVVLTVPSPIAARICPQLQSAERAAHLAIEYQGIVCASALLRKPLGGFYVTNLGDPDLPFTGIIEMTALVDPEVLGQQHLVYLPKYAGPDHPIWKMSDADIRRLFVGGLRRVYPHVSDVDVIEFKVSRVGRVFALPTLGYSDRLPSMRTSVPGLTIINSAHIVDGTLNVNETIRLANESATWLPRESEEEPTPNAQPLNPWINWWRDFECEEAYRFEAARRFVKEMEKYIAFRPDDNVLDIGCGPGYLADCIAHRVREFHGVDISERQLNRARIRLAGRKNVLFHAIDKEAYTDLSALSPCRFSLVVCVSVAQYYREMSELESLLRSVSRLVEPGCRMIVADLPDAEATPGEPFRLLWRCWKEKSLLLQLKLLMKLRWKSYVRIRRQKSLLRFRAAQLEALVTRLGFRSTVIRAPLTTLSGRIHLLICFS